jgi:polysaccharide pyruvyl transferase WcaK-like protein
LGVSKPNITITADPAFSIDLFSHNISTNIMFEENLSNSKNLVGYCIRKWPGDSHAADELAKIADYITENYDTTPVFIPMHYPFDIEASNLVVSKMKNKAYVISKKYAVSDILYLFSKLDLLVGMRLHSLIFAVKFAIPLIGISYEPKVDGFLKLIDQKPDINIKNLNFNDFKKKLDQIWLNKEQISLDLKQKNELITTSAANNSKFVTELLKLE